MPCRHGTIEGSVGMPHSLPSSAVSPGQVSLRKCYTIKFVLYVPLYRQVNEWMRYGLETNDKNLSNWVSSVRHMIGCCRSVRHMIGCCRCARPDEGTDDGKIPPPSSMWIETYGKVIHRSDGKSGQTNAYNWGISHSPEPRSRHDPVPKRPFSRARSVLESFIGASSEGSKGPSSATVIPPMGDHHLRRLFRLWQSAGHVQFANLLGACTPLLAEGRQQERPERS